MVWHCGGRNLPLRVTGAEAQGPHLLGLTLQKNMTTLPAFAATRRPCTELALPMDNLKAQNMNIAELPCSLRALARALPFLILLAAANPAWPAADALKGPLAQAPGSSVPGWMPPPAGTAPRFTPSARPPATQRQLLISVRYGAQGEAAIRRSETTSSREAATEDEQYFRVQDGEKVLIASRRRSLAAAAQVQVLVAPTTVIASRRHSPVAAVAVPGAAEESTSMIEVQPTLSGNTAQVRMVARRQTASPGGTGGSQGQHVETTLSLSLGEWVEVSGRGPWPASENRDTASTRDMREDARRVFLKIEELGR